MAKDVAKIRMNSDEIKDYLKFTITNNRFLQKLGKLPIACCITGDAGLGKTSIIMQTAAELGMDCVKRNLAEIQETAELIGFPLRQFQLCKVIEEGKTECIWVDEHALTEYTKNGYQFTGSKRTGYCPPEWVTNMKEGTILLADDFNR